MFQFMFKTIVRNVFMAGDRNIFSVRFSYRVRSFFIVNASNRFNVRFRSWLGLRVCLVLGICLV